LRYQKYKKDNTKFYKSMSSLVLM